MDHLFSSEETTLLDVWVDSSLVCGSDQLAVVGTYRTAHSAGVSGTDKKKRIPCALRWTANDPVAWEKAVGGSGEFGADWRDPLAFLGFLARTADAHKDTSKMRGGSGHLRSLKLQLQCATTAAERRRCNRLLWRRRRALARQRQVVFLREACEANTISGATEAWQPLQLGESFGAGTSVDGHQKFSTQTCSRSRFRPSAELQLNAKNERVLERRRALDNGAQEIEVSPRDVWQCLARLK